MWGAVLAGCWAERPAPAALDPGPAAPVEEAVTPRPETVVIVTEGRLRTSYACALPVGQEVFPVDLFADPATDPGCRVHGVRYQSDRPPQPVEGAVDGHAFRVAVGPVDARSEVVSVLARGRAWERLGPIGDCYRTALARTPHIAGKVTVAVTAEAGVPQDAVIEGNTSGDLGLERCVLGGVLAWHFDPRVEGDLRIPLVLQVRRPARRHTAPNASGAR